MKYQVIVADPPWRYGFSKSKNRKVENHYPTMSQRDIEALAVPAADDSVLFLWATAPKLIEALSVMRAWDFEYKTNGVWDKEKIGMGYWLRGQHELFLIGTRGKFSPPEPTHRRSSIIRSPRSRHSEKPNALQDWIDAAFPAATKLELFARTTRPGWASWGDEVDSDQSALI